MGLKKDLIDAKKAGLIASGAPQVETGKGSAIDIECTMIAAAISKVLTSADFTITELKAPIIVEDFSIPEQKVVVSIDTLMAEWKPVLDVLKKVATPLGIASLIDELQELLESIFESVVENGYKTQKININKTNGGLQSSGYAFVGNDPESKDSFNVENKFNQKLFTKVKLLPDEMGKLL